MTQTDTTSSRSMLRGPWPPTFLPLGLPGQGGERQSIHPLDKCTPSLPVPSELDRSHLVQAIEQLRRLGVESNRHSSPDLVAQLSACQDRTFDVVVCNLLDDDPHLPLNSAVAAESVSDLFEGVVTLARLVGASESVVVLASELPIPIIRDIPESARQARVRIALTSAVYPKSDPTLLLHSLLDRRLPPGRLPSEQGVLLLDAQAVVAAARALLHGEPMLDLPLVVRDHIRRESHFLRVPVGTTVRAVLRELGLAEQASLVRSGGLLRDVRVLPDQIIAGGELVFNVTPPEPPVNPEPCIRCGWCVESCPTRVQPAGLLEAAQRDDPAMAERYGIGGCIECGICSFVCPSHLPLLPAIRTMKTRVRRE